MMIRAVRGPRPTAPSGRPRLGGLGKWAKLACFSLLGISAVSIPVTAALVFSATGSSDLLTIGGTNATRHHESPAAAVASARCVSKRGYYALTFDDGPQPATTAQLVAGLKKAKAVATFFDLGARAAARQDLVELQRSVGQVANHSYSHPHLPAVSSARRLQELQATARVLDYPNALFRPPYGETSAATDADIRRAGLTPVYWTVDAQDARLDAKAITDRALGVQPGGIILLHEGVDATVDAIPDIVAGLKKRGMCAGFIAPSTNVVQGANGVAFRAAAVKP